MISLSALPLQNPAVFSRVLGEEEMILVNGDNAASMALTNRTAVLIWELVDGINSISTIIETIKGRFQQVPDSVEDDILSLLEKLTKNGFIGFECKPEGN